ncbi:response regulator [Pseudomonas sp. KCJK9016]|uniref:response regulator n=1 Tax=Pseudomonas sp. KCJK9016 TaxID=3344556 RepID=UPI003906135A
MIRPRLSPYTVMLVDDHKIIRFGITAWLSTELDIKVVGSYATSRELLAALARQEVDVVIIDFMLGETEIDGIHLIRTLRLRHPRCKILVLSSHYSTATVTLAMQNGCHGFYGKVQDLEELATAIRKVACGQTYLHPNMASELESQLKPSVTAATDEMGADQALARNKALSSKEQEVLRCFLNGMSVNEIAVKFSRSANTISTQKQSAYRKLGIKTDSELFKLDHLLRNE